MSAGKTTFVQYRSLPPAGLASAAPLAPAIAVVDLSEVPEGDASVAAREQVARRLGDREPGSDAVWVRVHAGDEGLDDLSLVVPEAGELLAGVFVPDVYDPRELDAVRRELELVEAVLDREDRPFPVGVVLTSSSAVLDCRDLAEAERVTVVLLDEAALRVELGLRPGSDGDALAVARGLVVLASAAAGRRRPIGWDPSVPDGLLSANGFGGAVRPLAVEV